MRIGQAVLGFLAGALAVFFFHQAAVGWLHGMGWLPNPPFRQTPVPPWGVPAIYNAMFWGGVWGALFGLLAPLHARWGAPLAGLVFGATLPVLGVWLLVPAIKGTPFLSGGDAAAMARIVLIHAVWGVGLGVFWALLAGARARAPVPPRG